MLILCNHLLDNFDRNITDSMQINSNKSQQLSEIRAKINGADKKREQKNKIASRVSGESDHSENKDLKTQIYQKYH